MSDRVIPYTPPGEQRPEDVFAELDARRIDPASPPPKPEAVFKLGHHEIATAGNVEVLSGQAKGGKSAATNAMLGSTLAADLGVMGADCFEFESKPTNGKAVIVFDTEQDAWRSHLQLARAAARVGLPPEAIPENIRAYRLLDIASEKRRAFLPLEMERAHKACGGIHCVLIDGVADLIVDPNDPNEAFPFVDELIQLAVRYECPIFTVLHENPASRENATGKTRGHLGSQLERKAESNLRIVKEGEISTLYSERCRGAHIPKEQGIRFTWSPEKGMHVTCATSASEDTQERKREEQRAACDAVFEGVVGTISWSELYKQIIATLKVSNATAERRIREWEKSNLIEKNRAGLYLRK